MEGQGFEPWNPFELPVFKTGAINHSASPPKRVLFQLSRDVALCWSAPEMVSLDGLEPPTYAL